MVLSGAVLVWFLVRLVRLGCYSTTLSILLLYSIDCISACYEYGHGRPGICWGSGQTVAYLKDMGMTGLASAWAMARWWPI